MIASDKALLIKLGALSLAAIVLWRVSKPFRDGLTSAKETLDSASKLAGETLSDVAATINGHVPVQLSAAAFYLNEKYIASDYTVNRSWKNTMIGTHIDIKPLFNEILDPKGRLKTKYQYLISGEVSQQTIYGSNTP